MKYIYYIQILFMVIIRRLIFPLIFLVIPFRQYLRNTVYNYHLNNSLILKRLQERNPILKDGFWILHGNTHSSENGVVKQKDISKIRYYFALVFWLLLDDDCNEDTYSKGFNKTIVTGKRKKWMPKFIKSKLETAIKTADKTPIKGNSFDLGDKREIFPLYDFWSTFWWTLRNPAYNFNYKYNQLIGDKYAFKIIIYNRLFGWEKRNTINGVNTYSWEFAKKYN